MNARQNCRRTFELSRLAPLSSSHSSTSGDWLHGELNRLTAWVLGRLCKDPCNRVVIIAPGKLIAQIPICQVAQIFSRVWVRGIVVGIINASGKVESSVVKHTHVRRADIVRVSWVKQWDRHIASVVER